MSSIRLDQFRLASHPDLQGIVRASLIAAAIEVRLEPADTPNHDRRMVLANTVYAEIGRADSETVRTFAWLVAMDDSVRSDAVSGDAVIPAAITDGHVDSVVADAFDRVAGVESL